MQPLSIAEKGNATTTTTAVDPLPSWNQGIVKTRILDFVKNVTNLESTNYIIPEDRIAVFDNDGTLWAEKPTYFQGFFVLDRLEELSKSNPEILSRNPQLQHLLNKNFTNL